MRIFEIFKGDKGEFSSKRFIGIVGGLALIVHMFLKPSNESISAVEFMVIFSLGYTSIDKYGRKN